MRLLVHLIRLRLLLSPGSSAPIQFIHVNFPPAPAPANSPAPGSIRFFHHDLHEFGPAPAPATPLFVHTHSHGYISNDITLHGHRTKDGDIVRQQRPQRSLALLISWTADMEERISFTPHVQQSRVTASQLGTMLLSVHTITQPTFDSWSEKLRYAKETAEIPQTKWHEWDTQRRLKNALTRLWELEIFLVEYVTAQGNEDKTGTVCLLFDSNPYCLKLELEMGNSIVMEGDPTLIGDATFADTKSKDDFHTFATDQRHRLPYDKNSLISEFMQEAALDDVVWEQAKIRSYLLDWNGMITEATLVVWQGEMARRVKDLEEFKKAKRVKNKKAYVKSTSRRTQQGVLQEGQWFMSMFNEYMKGNVVPTACIAAVWSDVCYKTLNRRPEAGAPYCAKVVVGIWPVADKNSHHARTG
ncbi:hypothetical protein F5878DRAFT_713708 [Lentinula raphanica]|uniref:Uncharacterized protein n=1 Tax=Lentinula raphanica TaxID=153919 RepID=A0AA38U5A1_9AGAR|nr:hypothetical protein F5878DRAFT_713708 [Lentinula raphanica]